MNAVASSCFKVNFWCPINAEWRPDSVHSNYDFLYALPFGYFFPFFYMLTIGKSDYNMEHDFKGGSGTWIYTCTQVTYWFAILPVPTPLLFFFLLFVKHTGHS